MSESAVTPFNTQEPPPNGGRNTYVSRKLHSVEGIRQEITRLYRDSRKGQLDSLDCHRLANVLHLAARLIEGTALEALIARLERGMSAGQVSVNARDL